MASAHNALCSKKLLKKTQIGGRGKKYICTTNMRQSGRVAIAKDAAKDRGQVQQRASIFEVVRGNIEDTNKVKAELKDNNRRLSRIEKELKVLNSEICSRIDDLPTPGDAVFYDTPPTSPPPARPPSRYHKKKNPAPPSSPTQTAQAMEELEAELPPKRKVPALRPREGNHSPTLD